ncbi:MAG TPA: DUF4892 domain-containing protein [Acidobacteriota bacterium]|nr:DUF4892 domain-containing protein [Acidobacteriota bacterium]
MRKITFLFVLLFPLALFAVEISQKAMKDKTDLPGSKDHMMITRVPDSWIVQYESKEFDEVEILQGAAVDKDKFTKSEKVQGKVTRIGYAFPDNRSVFEVSQAYLSALKGAGFKLIYSCNNERECGNWFANNFEDLPGENDSCYFYGCDEETQRYFAAKLTRPEGDVYVAVYAFTPVAHSKTPVALVRIIEVKPMEDLVKVDAAKMASDIRSEGHVAIYGIYFDFNKADVKPESATAIQEITKLLKLDPNLKLYVVGHTDSVGTVSYNMDLSQRRSEAVVRVLAQQNGITAGRLMGKGVGPLAPVAPNGSDEGRAKNRRVELVQQ